MPRPIALASGVFRLNVRVPHDLLAKVRGNQVILPFEGDTVTIVATDKVAFSLRTRDPALAKVRFTTAYAALTRHFDTLRAGPQPLTHKQAVALAGAIYRRRVERYENDPSITPEAARAAKQAMDELVARWRYGSGEGDDDFEITLDEARLYAAMQQRDGVQRLAWETQTDIDTDDLTLSLDDALETLFGHEADVICAERSVCIDAESRKLLLREIGKAARDAENKLARNLEGDYAPDPAAGRYPAFVPTSVTSPRNLKKSAVQETVGALYERWVTYHADKKSAATIRRYGPLLASLNAWLDGRDWRSITDVDIHSWATNRVETDGIAAATVNRNDLVAVSSVLKWPMTIQGGKLATTNPAEGVKLDLPKRRVRREKMFRAFEIAAILNLARSVIPDHRYPRASASRRWCPWLCAYSGARVQETLWLRKEDVRQESGVWIVDFQETKDGHARRVPIHAALIDEGFLAFVGAAPEGYLFVGDRKQKEGSTRTAQEMRAAKLASWIQAKINLDKGVSPNHAWRHTWITIAEAAGIPKRLSNRITGHNAGQDASDRYVNGTVSLLAVEMEKFPRYQI